MLRLVLKFNIYLISFSLSVCFVSSVQVSSIYKDPSIGNLINIVIVKLVIINNELVRTARFLLSLWDTYQQVNDVHTCHINDSCYYFLLPGWSSHFI